MEYNYSNLTQITRDFDIPPETPPEEIRKKLKSRLKEVHPDATKGQFFSTLQEQEYHRLQAAIKFLDSLDMENKPESDSIPHAHLPAVVEAVTKAIEKRSQPTIEQQEEVAKGEFFRATKRRYSFPKLTSGILAAIIAFIFAFSGQVKDNPLYVNFRATYAEGHETKVEHDIVKSLDYRSYEQMVNVSGSSNFPLLDDLRYQLLKVLDSVITDSIVKSIPHMYALAPDKKLHVPTKDWLEFWLKKYDEVLQHSSFLPGLDESDNNVLNRLTARLWELKGYHTNLTTAKTEYEEAFDQKASIVIAIILSICSLLFLMFWLRERSDSRWAEHLLTGDGLVEAFMRICSRVHRHENSRLLFTETEFTTAISRKPGRLLFREVDPIRLTKVSRLLIRKLIEQGAVTPSTVSDILDWYEIQSSMAKKYFESEEKD